MSYLAREGLLTMSQSLRHIAFCSTIVLAAIGAGLSACSSSNSDAGPNGAAGSSNPSAGASGFGFGTAGSVNPGGGAAPVAGGSNAGAGPGAGGVFAAGGLGAGGSMPGGGTSSVGGTGGAPIVCQPGQNRCECHTSVGLAVNQGVDSFEDGTLFIQQIDERNGEWFALPNGKAPKMVVEATTGSAPGSTKALHMVGNALMPDWPTYGVPLGICYDASVFDGISFWIKGNSSGKNDTIKVSLPTPPTTEKQSGGSCPNGDAGCYNHFAALITLAPTWTHYALKWSQFTQANWGATGVNGIAPAGFQFQKQILAVNFAPNDNTKGYDFSVDDVQLGAGGVVGHCGDLITKAQFEGFFPGHAGLYTYEGFVEAAKQWPLFCGEGDNDARKREVAAFFAHMVQETAGLKFLEEISPPIAYCDAAKPQFPCGNRSYHGRGPLQLSWNYNYGTAGQALGLSLLENPGLVVASSVNSFNAALWWWMTRQPLNSAHSTIVSGKGFGQTIQLINGALECGGKAPTAVNNRVNAFKSFTSQLGVSTGGNEGC